MRKAKWRCGIVLFKRTVEPAVRRALLEIEAIMVPELTIHRNTVPRKSARASNPECDTVRDTARTDRFIYIYICTYDSRRRRRRRFPSECVLRKRLATRHRRKVTTISGKSCSFGFGRARERMASVNSDLLCQLWFQCHEIVVPSSNSI